MGLLKVRAERCRSDKDEGEASPLYSSHEAGPLPPDGAIHCPRVVVATWAKVAIRRVTAALKRNGDIAKTQTRAASRLQGWFKLNPESNVCNHSGLQEA
mmetsp:Transcript_25890/g.60478  ORF Transcript_25890/g.60478 Transcript_25890/m.60478 type:complete len:99 (+) Transcript_25890:2239-2535(+)